MAHVVSLFSICNRVLCLSHAHVLGMYALVSEMNASAGVGAVGVAGLIHLVYSCFVLNWR